MSDLFWEHTRSRRQYRLVHGDAIQCLQRLPPASVDCIITSPPFWGLRNYGAPGQIGAEPTIDAYISRLADVFDQAKRILKQSGSCWVHLGDQYSNGHRRRRAPDRLTRHRELAKRPPDPSGIKPKELIGAHWRVISELQRRGWYVRSEIIWHKPNAIPESVKDRPMRAHEYIFLLTKTPNYRFFRNQLKKPGFVADRSVWRFAVGARRKATGHPAAMPEQLVEHMVALTCRQKFSILDPFCGCGTTGIVAARTSCDFLGIDLSRRFLRVSAKAIQAATQESSSHAALPMRAARPPIIKRP